MNEHRWQQDLQSWNRRRGSRVFAPGPRRLFSHVLVVTAAVVGTGVSPSANARQTARTPNAARAVDGNSNRVGQAGEPAKAKENPTRLTEEDSLRLRLMKSRGMTFALQGPRRLLEEPEVQKELGLSESQRLQIMEVIVEHMARLRALLDQKGQQLKALGTDVDFKAFDVQQKELERQLRVSFTTVMNPKQRKRAQEIYLQALGPIRALNDPYVMDKLKLTPRQLEKKALLLKEMERKVAVHQATYSRIRLSGAPFNDPTANELSARSQLEEIQTARAIVELMDDKQKKTYRALLGEDFDFRRIHHGPTRKPGGDPRLVPGVGAPSRP